METYRSKAAQYCKRRRGRFENRRRRAEKIGSGAQNPRRFDRKLRGHRQSFTQEPAVYDDDEPLDSISNLRPNEGQTSLQPDDDQEFEFKGLSSIPKEQAIELPEMYGK
jgi:hypothetical protein